MPHYSPLRRNTGGHTEFLDCCVGVNTAKKRQVGLRKTPRNSSLALRKPFTTGHIHQTWTPPASMQGRAVAARLKGGLFFDLFICCMYFPPRPQSASERGRYQRTIEELLGWLDDQRHRTTPVVLMDANDGVGLELRNRRYREVDTQCISAAGPVGSTSRAHRGQARQGDSGEASHARRISRTVWFDVVLGTGVRPRSSIMCGLLKRSFFDALALSDVWRLRYSSSTRAS